MNNQLINPASEIKALHDLAEHVLLTWLDQENPSDIRKMKALELLGDAGQLLRSACINLGVLRQEDDSTN